MHSKLQLVLNHPKPRAKVSIVLLDWGVRESFHSIRYLNAQTVPRDQYELIWVEFYDRVPPDLQRLTAAAGDPVLDKWLILGYPPQTCYHKHRMYNAAIVVAEGEICVFCDSDAIFQPTFVESIIKALAEENTVVHVDEVRNYSKRYYPFNYPALTEVLAEGCVNWTETTTTGLDNNPDMIHTANYGACMAARRTDLIRIGGADEHIDYLGYICGPYELTFRLVNEGHRERWLRDEYLFHVWHPNTSGCNVEYKGPDDGRGMSLRALDARRTGQILPYKGNPALRCLRQGEFVTREALLARLVSEDTDAWDVQLAMHLGSPPRLVEQGYHGFNIFLYAAVWYALPQSDGPFDPDKLQNQEYAQCFSAASRRKLLAILPIHRPGLRQSLVRFLRRVPFARPIRNRFRWFSSKRHMNPTAPLHDDGIPYLVEQEYLGFNVIWYGGLWYGLAQEEGRFDPDKFQDGQYARCVTASSYDAVKLAIRRSRPWARYVHRPWLPQSLVRFLRRVPFALAIRNRFRRFNSKRHVNPTALLHDDGIPCLVEEDYLGFNVIWYDGLWYGLGQEEGPFDPDKFQDGQYARCVTASSYDAVKLAIRRSRQWARRVKEFARKLIYSAPLDDKCESRT
jgi:hypothetical protein